MKFIIMMDKSLLVTAAHFMGTALVLNVANYILPISLTSYYFCIANLLLFSIVSWYTFRISKKTFLKDRIEPKNKAVLITGCDSGFGHNLAKRLDSKGFAVFATCMFPSGKGAEHLRQSCTSRLKILQLDVTKDESVKKAVLFVEQNLDSSELWAIVNNAGIHKGMSVDLTHMEDFRDCMEVNLFGVVRVTKAFLPFLKKTRGRVINITSIAGRGSVPHCFPYIVSKHAAVGFSDLLRQELVDWGITVISIEPELFRTGLTDTEINEKNILKTFAEQDENNKADYDEEYQKNFKRSQNFFISLASSNISAVIDDLESAICLKYPDDVYSPRRNAFVRFILFVLLAAPIPIRDIFIKIGLTIVRYKKPKRA